MSTWALIGLSIALLVAGFNVGYDCRHKKGLFNRNKKYRYWISCFYSVKGVGSIGGWAFDFDSEMNSSQLKIFREKQIENLKKKFETSDVEFCVIDFKKLK
ncbi:hypothetical protein [Fusobacterium nucleatum]|uniref:hypothetical protein n=1 Tax=Fusobacterium nucleatum TaxID=851 RepID=UPI003094AEEE